MDYQKKYEKWLNEPTFDQTFRSELSRLTENEKEDRFYKDLEFGTGGLRGVVGAGSNRMNKYVVMRVTQGYADYLNKRYENPSVAIAYDSRHFSDVFAQTAARVLGGNGIRVYLFDRISATPELSFAVRELSASGGIVVTASHNPKQYNGYKVYQQDGYQILPEEAKEIIESVGKIRFEDIKQCELDDEKIEMLGDAFIETYYHTVSDLVEDHGEKQLKIVYTPLNGAGARPVVEVLKRTGFNQLETVKEQMIHDPDFTTVPYPNPEEVAVFERAIALGEKMKADILMATDPDADRVGVVVRHNGQYTALNGNQIGALLSEYLLSNRPDQAIVTTIVSSHLCDKIARKYDASIYKTLTGFKFIGEMMTRFERTEDLFVLGFEESYGYLTSDHARDKDAVNAALVIAEMAETYLLTGKTLIDELEEVYREHGYFKEDLLNFKFEGSQGLGEMNALIERFRKLDGFEIVGSQLREKIDFLFEDTGLPRSNVIKFIYEDESWFAIRPSGTEPKLKIYLSVNSGSMDETEKRLETLKKRIYAFIGEAK
jgi:phosphoglucomutase